MGRFSALNSYRPSKTTWFWSGVGCVIATMIVGFNWGGWVTTGTADTMSAQAAQQARAEMAADYCVSRFEATPDATNKLADLKKTDSWQRSDFIDKRGWDKFPGLNEAVDGSADLCADRLINAKLTPVKPATAS